MSEFKMPSLGADMESAVLMEWKTKEGDKVKKGDIIAEVETSKGVIEIEIFEDGTIEKLLAKPENEYRVGDVLAIIKNETIPQAAEEQRERQKISPAAKKKAQELGIDLSVLAKNKEGIHLSEIEKIQKTEHKALDKDSIRTAIANAMSRSNAEIPHYYLSTKINMTSALNYLEELNKTRSIKDRILPAALLIYAIVKILKEVSELNGFWKDGRLEIKKEINPAIAISLRGGGLITPALLNADKMSLDQVMQSLGDLISRTRGGKLRGAELSEQTITITNLGDLGVETVYGIIYPPQVALIGIGKIIDSPWVLENSVVVQKVLKITLAGDHRATDGLLGALFLDKLTKFLQSKELE